MFSALAFVLALSAQALAASEYTIHHRIVHPSYPPPPFSPRGQVVLAPDAPAALTPAPDYAGDISDFGGALREALLAGFGARDVLYQVALERPGDADPGAYDIASVRACLLALATAETFVLHVSPGPHGTAHALDYFLTSIPHDGACPPAFSPGAETSLIDAVALKPFANTTVGVKTPKAPVTPPLREPPPLTPQGEVVRPEPEKTFVQKYWIYGVGILIALMIAPGGEEPPPGQAQARGGAGGGR